MPHDAFRHLRTMADHAETFGAANTQAEAAAAAIFAAAIKEASREKLALIHGALGIQDFDALADRLKSGDVRALVDRIDGPARPARTLKAALARLKQIGQGKDPELPIDLAALDLAGLRKAHDALGDKFEGWLSKQGNKAKAALQAMDPGVPNVDRITPAKARPRLAELARGAKSTPPFRLPDLDVDGLRRARADLGDDFESWLSRQKGPDLKAALVRMDPRRPRVGKLPKADYPFLLNEIAAGGPLVTSDEDTPPIGEVKFSMRDR